MSRGVLYLVWEGQGTKTTSALQRSRESLAKWHPELPVRVEVLPEDSTLLDKSRMAALSPFAETLFLDADTVVLGRLDFGFRQAERHGLACCICECPWARRYPSLVGDAVEYNTGVLFWTAAARPVFDAWAANRGIDSSILFHAAGGRMARMPQNDQAGFALAIEQTGFNPCILPLNWNFRPLWHRSWFGPLKIWHDYSEVPRGILAWNERQSEPGAVIRYLVAEEPR